MKIGSYSGRFGFRISARRLASCNELGELAETERHHPDIAFGWGQATVSLQTKKIKGLHQNDFIMAAKIDRLAPVFGVQGSRQPTPMAARL
jgi:4a-hydroxytetrahydrobiopterin dehydratase